MGNPVNELFDIKDFANYGAGVTNRLECKEEKKVEAIMDGINIKKARNDFALKIYFTKWEIFGQ